MVFTRQLPRGVQFEQGLERLLVRRFHRTKVMQGMDNMQDMKSTKGLKLIDAATPYDNNAVTTDEQGKYSLSLPAGKYTIIISYTGYEEHTAIVTIKAGDASMYNATLVLTANNLTEITVGSRVRDSRGKLSTPVPVDVIRTKDIATLAQSDLGKLMKMVK